MPKPTRDKPDDSLKAHFITKDGFLWWNPEFKETHPKRDYSSPIGVRRNSKHPTVFVEGEMYHIHRLNYWMHKNEWPVIVDIKDDTDQPLHIDSLFASSIAQVRGTGKGSRTYCIKQETRKDGSTAYSSRMVINGKMKVVGTFDKEEDAVEAAKAVRWLMYRTDDAPKLLNRLIK